MPPDQRRDQELLEKSRQGRLTAEEGRELAQRSLANDELFEDMALDGLISEGLSDPEFRRKWLAPAAPQRNQASRWMTWGLSLAAGVAALAFTAYFVRNRDVRSEPAVEIAQKSIPSAPPLPPVLIRADGDHPILLASRLAPMEAGQTVFRGEATAGRMPNQTGTVVSSDESGVVVSLGSVDGLSDGSLLSVKRGTVAVGQVAVKMLFRDRSRTLIAQGGPIEAGDQVAVDPGTYLRALWARADALAAGKDYAGARRLFATAQEFADVPLKRLAQEKLATAEFQAGDLAAARRRFRGIASSAPPATGSEASGAWEALGVISLLSGDVPDAEAVLLEAEKLAVRSGSAIAQARAWNNLAVVAEMKNDRGAAIQLLEKAGKILEGTESADRQAITANLERLRRAK